MPVYLFTFHTYRSWMPDHRRGFVKRGQGVQATDLNLAVAYARRARFEPVRLDEAMCRIALKAVRRVCTSPARPGWKLHMAVVVFNHLHALVSWQDHSDPARAKAVLHRAITVDLRDALGWEPGRPLLARGGNQRRVLTRNHFDHLYHRYLPAHQKYRGIILTEQ